MMKSGYSETATDIRVVGSGCANCRKLYQEAEKAIEQLAVPATLTKVERIEEIMSYKLLMTPALVVNGEVKSAGRIPNAAEIMTWIPRPAGKE